MYFGIKRNIYNAPRFRIILTLVSMYHLSRTETSYPVLKVSTHRFQVETSYHLIFRDISLKKSGTVCFVFRHISFIIQWIFICSTFSLGYPVRVRLFIRIFIFGFIRM